MALARRELPRSEKPKPSALEAQARSAWHAWGDNYSAYTSCHACGEVAHCRGVKRDRMLCLECWDGGAR